MQLIQRDYFNEECQNASRKKKVNIMKAQSTDEMMVISCLSFQQPKILSEGFQPNGNLKCYINLYITGRYQVK